MTSLQSLEAYARVVKEEGSTLVTSAARSILTMIGVPEVVNRLSSPSRLEYLNVTLKCSISHSLKML